MRSRNIARWLVLANLVLFPTVLAAQISVKHDAAEAKAWGDPVHGLQISLYFDPVQSGATPRLRVGFRNVSASEITVALGGGCGMRTPEPNGIVLLVKGADGKEQLLQHLGPEPYEWFCTGVGAVYKQALPSGEEFSIPINLSYFKYHVKAKGDFESPWQPGGMYSLRAEMDPDRNLAYDLKSNEIEVHFPANDLPPDQIRLPQSDSGTQQAAAPK